MLKSIFATYYGKLFVTRCLAVLLTYQGYSDVAGVVVGIGPDTALAFSIVEVHYGISQYVFAHELGHLFGARHNWPIDAGDDEENVCNHGKRWIQTPPNVVYDEFLDIYDVEKSWSTIVSVDVSTNGTISYLITDENGSYSAFFLSDTRILHYSNPDVFYGLEATGRPEGYIANNALLIRNTACTVGDFFPTRELRVLIIHELDNPCLSTMTFSAIIFRPESGIAGQAPYTVNWYWNTTGHFSSTNPGTFLGQGADITISPYPACPVFWLKCKVTSSDGVTVSRIQRVYIGPAACCTESSEEKPLSTIADNFAQDKLFPNPVNDGILTFIFEGAEATRMDFEIIDVHGRVLSTGNIEVNSNGSSPIDVSRLKTGIYFLHLKGLRSRTNNYKFIIAQN